MRFHFVTVPIHGSLDVEEELNRFLTAHRVIAIDRQLVSDGARSCWSNPRWWPAFSSGAAP
jgi:hypothetical protein